MYEHHYDDHYHRPGMSPGTKRLIKRVLAFIAVVVLLLIAVAGYAAYRVVNLVTDPELVAKVAESDVTKKVIDTSATLAGAAAAAAMSEEEVPEAVQQTVLNEFETFAVEAKPAK